MKPKNSSVGWPRRLLEVEISAGQILQVKLRQRARLRQPGAALQWHAGRAEQACQQRAGQQRGRADQGEQQQGTTIHAAIITQRRRRQEP